MAFPTSFWFVLIKTGSFMSSLFHCAHNFQMFMQIIARTKQSGEIIKMFLSNEDEECLMVSKENLTYAIYINLSSQTGICYTLTPKSAKTKRTKDSWLTCGNTT